MYFPSVNCIFENDEWSVRNNNELYELYGEPQIIGEIKNSRFRWAGHMQRCDEKSLIKKVLNGKPGGERCIGRPRKKPLEDVEEDIKEIGQIGLLLFCRLWS